MRKIPLKNILFLGSTKKDLSQFPQPVKDDVGFDLYLVQSGQTPASAKALKGLPGVMELVARYDKDTYRAVYTVSLGDTLYILHSFKKKSSSGIKTAKKDIDLIKQRLKLAKEIEHEKSNQRN